MVHVGVEGGGCGGDQEGDPRGKLPDSGGDHEDQEGQAQRHNRSGVDGKPEAAAGNQPGDAVGQETQPQHGKGDQHDPVAGHHQESSRQGEEKGDHVAADPIGESLERDGPGFPDRLDHVEEFEGKVRIPGYRFPENVIFQL